MVKSRKVIENVFGKESFSIRFVGDGVIFEDEGTVTCNKESERDFLNVAFAFQKRGYIEFRKIKNSEDSKYFVCDTSSGANEAYGILFRKMLGVQNIYIKEQISLANKKRGIRIRFVDGKKIYIPDPEDNAKMFIVNKKYLQDFLDCTRRFANGLVDVVSYADCSFGIFYGPKVALEDIRMMQTPTDMIARLYAHRARMFEEQQRALKKKSNQLNFETVIA